MKRLLVLIVGVVLLAAFVGSVAAQTAPQYVGKIVFQPDKDRYKRGEQLRYVVTITKADGTPAANQTFRVVLIHDLGRKHLDKLVLNEQGRGSDTITVPESPRMDNNFITVMLGDTVICKKRIPIG